MVDTYVEVKRLREYAEENNIPIMQEDGIDYLTTFVIKHKTKHVLEIGTAIGYSAIMMALANPTLQVTSIERDHERYLEALKNVKKFGLEDRITLIFHDALEIQINDKFDLIFIDAAKAQNIHFFEKFAPNLEDGGFIITDNLKFHGYVEKDEVDIKSHNLRGLVRKIKEYIAFLKNNKEYVTEFLEIGDGISVTSKRD